jgi:phosphoribosylformimino-5-aminoimidazole carboxamide ribotide isomerase
LAAFSTTLACIAFPQAALAQDNAAQNAEDQADTNLTSEDENVIIVTGFRGSVANAISEKRDLPFIADVVSADDIAGLPDTSIAESLARLPGVTSQRTGGQASAINIRGLSQDLVSASLNGREQVATSGDRVIEFNQYPSELIRQAAVYKTPVASIIAGGIAGRVELETVRPLDNSDDFVGAINIRGLYNDRAGQSTDVGEFGYRVSGSIQAKLADDTLGLALGYARLFQPNVATRFAQFDFPLPGNNGSPAGEDFDGNGIDDRRSFGNELIQFGGREERDGLIGVIQYEPVPELRVLIDGYYSRLESDVFRRGIRVFSTQSGDTVITNPVVVNDAITGGTFTNQLGANGFGFSLGTELVNQDEGRSDELFTLGGNIAYDFSDRFTAALDLSFSRGESFFNNSGINLRPFTTDPTGALVRADQVPGLLSTTFQTNGLSLPVISAISGDFTNTQTEFLLDGQFLVPQEDTDELFAVAVDFDLDLGGGFFKSFEFGARYAQRDAERIITSFDTFNIPGAPFVVPSDLVSIGGFGGAFAANGFPDFAAVDIGGTFDAVFGPDGGTGRPTGQDVFSFTQDQSFTIDEDVLSAYLQFNIDTIAGGLPLQGNIGVRFVYTDQASGSTVAIPGGDALIDRVPVSAGDSFLDILPSVNLILNLSDNDVLRLSATRQISRPSLFDLRGAIGAGVGNDGIPAGGGGNPFLRPFRANQFDISYEHYIGSDGILAVAAFYKDLETFIVGGIVPDFNFADAGFQLVPPTTDVVVQDSGPLSAPVNGDGGFVWGVEFNLTYSFANLLPAPLDGFGVILNYSYSESDLDFPSATSGENINLPLPGLSESVANPTIYYEKSGFGARVGMRYRTSFVAPQIGISELIVTNASETVFDAQVSYDFPEDSFLGGLKILAQANNFTDEPTRSFFGQRAQTGTLQFFGRTFFLGATYSF